MKVTGTVTRVVEGADGQAGKVFFRPDDQGIYRKLAVAHLTASGEIVVDAGDGKHAVNESGEFEVAGEGDAQVKDAEDDETKEVPPQGDALDETKAV
jgi:hypothetical protein